MTRGFTLIEMLVSVAIFSVVMVIALGALLSISVSDRKAETLKSVINNLNFSLDSMSRSMRTGSGWNCATANGGDCSSGGTFMAFVPANGVGHVYYKLETLTTDAGNAASLCGQTSPNIGCIVRSTDNGVTWAPITSSEVIMNDANIFYLVGSVQGGSSSPEPAQPKIIISFSGYVKVSGGASSQATCNTGSNQCSVFRLQSTVTQRLYDQ